MLTNKNIISLVQSATEFFVSYFLFYKNKREDEGFVFF